MKLCHLERLYDMISRFQVQKNDLVCLFGDMTTASVPSEQKQLICFVSNYIVQGLSNRGVGRSEILWQGACSTPRPFEEKLFASKGSLSYHLCVECFSQLSFDSGAYTKSAAVADFVYTSESNESCEKHSKQR